MLSKWKAWCRSLFIPAMPMPLDCYAEFKALCVSFEHVSDFVLQFTQPLDLFYRTFSEGFHYVHERMASWTKQIVDGGFISLLTPEGFNS